MALPNYVTSQAVGVAGFATTMAIQADLGAGSDLGLIVQAYCDAGGSATNITAITVGGTMSGGTTTGTVGVAGTYNKDGTISGGVALTLGAQVAGASFLGGPGNARAGALAGVTVPSGVQWVQMVCNDANAKPTLICATFSGVTAISAGTGFAQLTNTPTPSINCSADAMAGAVFYSSADDGYTISATSPSVQRLRGTGSQAQGYTSLVWTEPGPGTPVVVTGSNTGTFTPSNAGTIFSITGTVTPPGPTINTQPTAQTVSEGAAATFTVSATSSGGALSYQWQRQAPGGGAFSNVGTNSASYTTAATVCATDHGAQVRVQVTDSNGTTQSSTVGLTVNATSSTSRPGADVTVAGWTASTGSDLFAMIDEISPVDGDYITSPGLTGSTAPATFALAYPLAAGNRVVGVRARTDTGTATLRVYLLNDAGTVMGTTADQAINSSFATYSLAVTLSGAATRARIEVVV